MKIYIMGYFEIIKNRILSIREINWKELRKKFYQKKLA